MRPKAKAMLPGTGCCCARASIPHGTSLVPAKWDPKSICQGLVCPPFFLPGAPVIGFVAPSCVCQVNCMAGSQLSGPWVGQRLARYRPWAFKQNVRLLVPSKPGKIPSSCSPIPLENPLV